MKSKQDFCWSVHWLSAFWQVGNPDCSAQFAGAAAAAGIVCGHRLAGRSDWEDIFTYGCNLLNSGEDDHGRESRMHHFELCVESVYDMVSNK